MAFVSRVRAAGGAPPPGPPPFAGLPAMLRAPHRFLHRLLGRYGDVVRYRALLTLHVVNRPHHVRKLLAAPEGLVSKRTIDYRVLSVVFGQGLVTSHGEFWAQQRRRLQPVFTSARINGFDAPINRLAARMLDDWRPGRVLRLEREMSRLALGIAATTLFGTALDAHADQVFSILRVLNRSTQDPRALATLAPWLPLPGNRRFFAALRRLHGIVDELIAARQVDADAAPDLLSLLLAARDDQGRPLPPALVRDEVVTFLLAGHETSANALVWTLYLLARHPQVDGALAEELRAVLGGRPAGAGDLSRMPLLRQVVQESMRLYPPVWAIGRRAEQAMAFGPYVVPAGSAVYVCQYALHRHPDLWPQPERFDPERFSAARVAGRDRYAWLPFGAGPRSCIGAAMAMLEVQLVLAQLLPRFRLELLDERPIEAEARVTLTPRHGLPMRLRPR